MTLAAPSILSADFASLGAEVAAIEAAGADWIHIDVMDGAFVPNITFGPPVVASLRSHAAIPFDVHLMIIEPDRHLAAFAAAGADLITVHAEACPHLHRSLQAIRGLTTTTGRPVGCGVALNPHTPLSFVEHVLEGLDLVLVMTVNPGFGGQRFIESMTRKIAALREMIDRRRLDCRIEVDGGINPATAGQAVRAGADVLVAGNYVFGAPDRRDAIIFLKSAGDVV